MAFTSRLSRGRWRAAKLRRAASSVAPVAYGYERSRERRRRERHCPACFSRPATTIQSRGERI